MSPAASITIVPAADDLVAATADLLLAGFAPLDPARGVDLSEATVIFPGERPGHFLRREIGRRVGRAFSPPRVLTLNGVVDELFERWHGGELPMAQAIDAVAVLHEIQRESRAAIGGDAFAALDAFLPLGMRIFDSLEELTLEGVSAGQLAGVQALVEGALPARSRERLATLAEFQAQLYPRLAQRGLSTRSVRYREAAERLTAADVSSWQPIVISGFLELAAAERQIISTLASLPQGRLVFHAGRGLAVELARLGVPPGGHPAAEPAGRAPRVTTSPDTHGEAFALAAALHDPDEDTVIVLPSPESLFPLERYCLSRLDRGSYNVSLGYPLTRTPLYGFFGDLADLVLSADGDRLYLPDYLSFILHPYAKNVLFRGHAEPTRVLMHEVERRLSSRRTRAFVTLEEIEHDAALFETAASRLAPEASELSAEDLAGLLREIHDATIRAFRSFPDVAAFADRSIALVEWVHERTTARRHPHFLPFAEQMVSALEAIRRSLLADRTFDGASGYFALLRRYLASARVPFPGTPLHGLQVLGSMETRCLRFSRVFVLDANEGALPSVSRDDSLLSLAIREALGLPTWRDRERREQYRFEELAAGARELHLFCVDDGASEPSRFVERLTWEGERRGMAPHSAAVRYGITLATRIPDPIAKTAEVASWLRAIPLSPSSLDAWLACPLSFYYKRVLRLEERDEVTGEIEHVDIGSFVHRVLAEYFERFRGHELTPGSLDAAELAALASDRFPETFGAADAGRARLLRNQLVRHFRDFIDGWLRPLSARVRLVVLEVERRITQQAAGISLTGTLDAVFERDGEPSILDYKSAYNDRYYRPSLEKLSLEDRDSWLPALKSLQLPAYLLLYGAETGREPHSMDARFLLLGRNALDERMEVPMFTDRDEAEREWPRVLEVFRRVVAEVLDPAVPFSPTAEQAARCPRCPYAAACGAGWAV